MHLPPTCPTPPQNFKSWPCDQSLSIFVFNAARSPKYNLFKPWWSIWRLHTLLILATPVESEKLFWNSGTRCFGQQQYPEHVHWKWHAKFSIIVFFLIKKNSSNLYNSDSYKNGTFVLQFQSWNTCSTCRLIVLGTFTIILAFRYSPQISSILLEETGWQCSLTLHV